MNIDDIVMVKEGGRRKLLRVRLPDIYGFDEKWYVKTLLRGEIFNVYDILGHPKRKLPEENKKAEAKLHDEITRLALVECPDWYRINTAPAGINKQLATTVLEHSGFVDETESQNKLLALATEYTNSTEGRAESIVMHYLHISRYELSQMNYEEFFRCTLQAIFIGFAVDGLSLEHYLDPKTEETPIEASEQTVQAVRPQQSPPPRSNAQVSNLRNILNRTPDLSASTIQSIMKLDPSTVATSQPRVFIAGETIPDMAVLQRTVQADSVGVGGSNQFTHYDVKAPSRPTRRR